jgi:uncharacterized membrane protein YraQ (UPF0718 family)
LARDQWLLSLALVLFVWGFMVAPSRAMEALHVSVNAFLQVLPLIVAVMGLVGLIQAWLNRDLVARVLGREGGFKALFLAAFSGMVLIGPAYLIFPLLMTIHRQGARWAVIATVLFSYAVKIQMLPLEAGYLGWQFSLARTLLTLLFAVPVGLLVEWLMGENDKE